MVPRYPRRSTLFPYTTLFRSCTGIKVRSGTQKETLRRRLRRTKFDRCKGGRRLETQIFEQAAHGFPQDGMDQIDRKSTRLNSSHPSISYAVFCLKKKRRTDNL